MKRFVFQQKFKLIPYSFITSKRFKWYPKQIIILNIYEINTYAILQVKVEFRKLRFMKILFFQWYLTEMKMFWIHDFDTAEN